MLTSTPTADPGLNQKLALYSRNSIKTRRIAKPLSEINLAITNWYVRMDFWKEEFEQYARLVELHLNELPKNAILLKRNYIPVKTAIVEKLPLLEMELTDFETSLKDDLLFISGIKKPNHSWQQIEKELLAFETEHNKNRRGFLDMILQAIPLKIF